MVDVSNVLSGILRFRVTKSNNLWNVVQVEKSYPFWNTKIGVELEVRMVLCSDPSNYCHKAFYNLLS